jgi:hypothetical protein
MKLSNKILLGFFGFLFLYLTAAFTEVRLAGTPNIISEKNSIAETVDLPGISYVVLNDVDKTVKITQSGNPRLEVRSLSGGMLKKLTYKISGDTLTLSDLESEDTRTMTITVVVPNTTFKGITVNSSTASVSGLDQERLDISQNSGRIYMSQSTIERIQLNLSNKSFFDINEAELDTVSANIEASQAIINSPVGLMQGSMENAAYLRVNDIREIRLKKDQSSNLNMYQ